MGRLPFYLVDVFAERKYAGNQLAVVHSRGALSAEQMQEVANEMHFSETAFILSRHQRSEGFDVRIFTPSTEVPFAGHPALGAAYVIRRFLLKKPVSRVLLNLKVGHVAVDFEGARLSDGLLWVEQVPPVFGRTFGAARLARVLSLDLSDFDSRYPVQEVSTGLPFVIVPLKSLAAVRRARISLGDLMDLSREVKAGILVFCPEVYEASNDLNVRVFVDLFGIPEDPATGSGNGCLAGYLSRYRYFGSEEVNARVEQGYEIGRRSLLLLKAENAAGVLRVHVGGKVILVACGELV
ncbi:MAG: PhzF family phenazine biosynthesis protein [Candidatus Bathyarchaeota archaeon]|nr:PhzF family phenazine biosynthesis protein [Candidatus Bathyarchaeota archaeon]